MSTTTKECLTEAFETLLRPSASGRPVQMSFSANSEPMERFSKTLQRSKRASATNLEQFYSFQRTIRPIFGKQGVRKPDIGDHPDFLYLRGTDESARSSVATLFMDIEGSTRFGLVYDLEDVRRIKNAFICSAIQVISSFDGHVHRIMGDAVMAFFGGLNANPENAVIDALNCAAVLRQFATRVVGPKLVEFGFSQEFGIRIGLDFGTEEQVLWSSYGYPQSEEVTATSFYVDVAAKLQHGAGRNQVMIGDSIRSFLDFPDDLLSVKTVLRDGKEERRPFVTPNHKLEDGKTIDYRQFVLNSESYLKLGAFGLNDPSMLVLPPKSRSTFPLRIDASMSDKKGGFIQQPLPLCSSVVAKDKWICFVPRLPVAITLPYTIKCSVINHGAEALRLGGNNRGNHSSEYRITCESEQRAFKHWETTAYRGLHYLKIKVFSKAGDFEGIVGVFVA